MEKEKEMEWKDKILEVKKKVIIKDSIMKEDEIGKVKIK
jgi:hypothetical protein